MGKASAVDSRKKKATYVFGTPSSLTPLSFTPSSAAANSVLPGLRSAGRMIVWALLAATLVAGVVLFLIYGRDVTPLLHAGR